MQETLTPASLTTVALRAALRAQPTLRLPRGTKTAGSTLAAMDLCAWSGFSVFWSDYDRDALLAEIRKAKSIASHLKARPEFMAAVATEMYLSQSSNAAVLSLEDLTSATWGILPKDIASQAAKEIQADIALLTTETLEVLARRPLWSEEPSTWRTLVDEYAKELNHSGLGGLSHRYVQTIERVARDGIAGNAFTPDRLLQTRLEQSPGPTTDDHAHHGGSTEASSRTRVDLTAYSFSWAAQQILATAVQHLHDREKASLSTSALVLETAELGRPTADPQWVGDFVRQAVSPFPKQYAAALKSAGFRPDRERVSADDPVVRERMKNVVTMPGLAWSFERARALARETTGGETVAGRHLFASLILEPPPPFELGSKRVLEAIGLDVPLLRQRLFDWVRGYGDDDAAWRRALVGAAATSRRRAGFDADGTTGPDFLDIEQDVLALATLIAARDSSPPLSIGLFGDWGSGKTFFMNRLRRTVADLSAEARAANVMQRDHWFYKRIVQIEFNAWHYVEGNLWASMVEHILSNLRFSEEPVPTTTELLQKHLIDRLGFTEQAAADSEKKRQDAATRVTVAEKDVRDAKEKHDTKKEELQNLSRQSVARDFDLGGVKDAVADALKPLGIVPAGEAVADMEASLRLARSVIERGHAGLTSLVRAEDRKDRWRSLVIILIGAPVATGLLTWLISLMTQAQIARVSTLVTGAAGLLVAVARWIRQQAEWLAAQQEKVEEAQRKYDAALSAKLAEQAAEVANTEQQLALARQDYLLAQQRAEQARREQEAAGAELAAATTPRLLGRFIQDRAASTDYRKHLGVLAVVRQDFQQLSKLIEEDNWRLAPDNPADDKRYQGRLTKVASLSEEATEDATRINRIVLYIDDLDRCPPAKVVEVLQAVHLLLAFPLFVVVVGVDARWISRSLESRYRELLRIGDREAAGDIAEMFGVARSEDYLEKIFQIPLWLRRMDANAARRMVQGILRTGAPAPKRNDREGDAPSTKAPETTSPPAPGVAASPAAPQSSAPPLSSPPQAPDPQSVQTSVGTDALPHEEPARPAAVNPETFTVRDFEIQVIDTLSPLLGRSPRALKRFVNLYRLIKAGMSPSEHDVFIRRSKDGPDDFAAVLFLLAVDTGLPNASTGVFDVLLPLSGDDADIDVTEFVKRLDRHPTATAADSIALKAWIERYSQSRWFQHDAVRRLADWAPRVMRYSFQAARIVGEPSRRNPEPAKRKRSQT